MVRGERTLSEEVGAQEKGAMCARERNGGGGKERLTF
jgi:hypothetical protein